MKTNPWEEDGAPWKTQPAFFSWLRGNLRKAWMRYPISNMFKNKLCEPSKTGRAKWIGKCSICEESFAKTNLQVDHVRPCGSLRSWEDLSGFCENMFCASSGMRLVCKKCHDIVTLAERKGISFAKAKLEKQVIAFTKLSPSSQKEILSLDGVREMPGKKSDRVNLFKRLLAKQQTKETDK